MRVHTPQDGCYNGRRNMEPTQNPALRKKHFCLAYWKEHAHYLLISVLLSLALPAGAAQRPADYFKIVVVDQDTGRGVPLVELRTTYEVSYYTDSNGIVAFYEPGLMNQSVWFSVQSHGYEYPQDFLGSHGTTLEITPGGTAFLKIKRLNVAERLYRLTGEGIYRDSVLVGARVPIQQPALNARSRGRTVRTPFFTTAKSIGFSGTQVRSPILSEILRNQERYPNCRVTEDWIQA